MQLWFQWLAVIAALLAISLETVTLYKNSQETIINTNKIREGKATADSAEATAKIESEIVSQKHVNSSIKRTLNLPD